MGFVLVNSGLHQSILRLPVSSIVSQFGVKRRALSCPGSGKSHQLCIVTCPLGNLLPHPRALGSLHGTTHILTSFLCILARCPWPLCPSDIHTQQANQEPVELAFHPVVQPQFLPPQLRPPPFLHLSSNVISNLFFYCDIVRTTFYIVSQDTHSNLYILYALIFPFCFICFFLNVGHYSIYGFHNPLMDQDLQVEKHCSVVIVLQHKHYAPSPAWLCFCYPKDSFETQKFTFKL